VFDPAVVGRRRRLAALVIVALVWLAGHVWVRLQMDDLGYRIQRRTALIEELDHEYSELVAEFNRETSPALLRERAKMSLGLDEPAAGQVVTVYSPEEADDGP